MKMCSAHWVELKKALDDRGLMGLVHQGGEALKEALARQAEGTDTPQDFDPLMSANFAIWNNAIASGGLYLLSGVDDKGNEYCPLCEMETHTHQKAAVWIQPCADEQLEHARKLGLVSKPN